MRRMLKQVFLASVLVAFIAPGVTATRAAPSDPTGDRLMMTAGFLAHHPDLRYRLLGMEAMKDGRAEDALRFFQRASFYSDKPSQGMVAEMLWNGQGVKQDRALGYAWMDLAAERGYVGFLGLRERYWKELDEAERARAIEQGRDVYARYGDAAAAPRLAAQLRFGRRQSTGSRTGFSGNMKIIVPGPSGTETIDGSKFHDERYWDPRQYMAWHDRIWKAPRIGRVDVGDLEVVRATDAEQQRSRIPETLPELEVEPPPVPDEAPSPWHLPDGFDSRLDGKAVVGGA
jgi:uncharacterized protein